MFTLLTTYLTAAFETVTLFGVSLIFFLVHDQSLPHKVSIQCGMASVLAPFSHDCGQMISHWLC